MRHMGMLVPLAFIVIPTVVSAETWTAETVLDKEKSKSGTLSESDRGAIPDARCPGVRINYTLDLTDNTFTATSTYGQMFSIAVPADGVIKKTYKRVGYNRGPALGAGVTLEMTGNVKSRKLEIFEADMGCYYKLTAAPSLPLPPPPSARGQMSDADYCRALTQKYETYVVGNMSISSTHTPNTADGNVAVLQCEAGNTASGIPVLERKLRDAKVDLPSLPPPRSLPAAAQMSDADYCRALAQKYAIYFSMGSSLSPTQNTAAGDIAISRCEAGDTASGIPVLERKLRDAKIDLPTRG
jgi:hypothetical protein